MLLAVYLASYLLFFFCLPDGYRATTLEATISGGRLSEMSKKYRTVPFSYMQRAIASGRKPKAI